MASGHLEKRSNSSWTIVIELDRDPATGERKRIRKAFKGNQKKAKSEMNKLIREIETGTYIEPSKMTVGEFLEHWLITAKKPKIAPSTFERYERIVKGHLSPELGPIMLEKLQPMMIQSYYSRALESGRLNSPGGLSKRTVEQHHTVLRNALQQALKWQLIYRNPADAVECPRPDNPEIYPLDSEGIKNLLQLIHDHQDEELIITALYTGMREGELLALRWSDVDLNKKIINIQRSVGKIKGEFVYRKGGKTGKGRQVKITSNVISALKSQRIKLAQNKLLLGKNYQDNSLVFPDQLGGPQSADNTGRRFKTLAKKLGFPKMRFHDLRHTHATDLLGKGVHPRIVQERLGHKNIGITMDIYSHVLPDMQDKVVELMEEDFLFEEFGPQKGTKIEKSTENGGNCES